MRHGRKRITRTAPTYELAKEIESKLLVDIKRKENDLERKRPAPSLASVWKKYEVWAEENKKSWKTDKYYYGKHLEPIFGTKSLDDITPFDIEKLMVKMKKGKNHHGKPYAPATIKHQVVLLSRLFSLAETWEMYSGKNPCKRVKKPKLNNKKTEFLTDNEFSRLMKTLNKWKNKQTVSFIKFALYTGLRRGELFKLKWTDVDLIRKTMVLRNPKGGIDQTLPLSKHAIKVLEEISQEVDSPWVFYGKNGKQRTDFKGPWERIRGEAKLPKDFRLHGLRHHYASTLASSGVDLYVIQKLLTHKDASTTQRYAHLADRALRDAVHLSDSLLTPRKKAEIVSIKRD